MVENIPVVAGYPSILCNEFLYAIEYTAQNDYYMASIFHNQRSKLVLSPDWFEKMGTRNEGYHIFVSWCQKFSEDPSL